MLMTVYGTGLRRTELLQLKVRDIDSQRIVLRVERGKGEHTREVPLSGTLLATPREYYRCVRPPQTYLFPGTQDGGARIVPHLESRLGDAVRCRVDLSRLGSLEQAPEAGL